MATVAEAAARLRLSVDSVYRLVRRGRLRAFYEPGVRGMSIADQDIDALLGGLATDASDMIRIREAALRLGISSEWVRAHIARGDLPACKYGPRNSPVMIPAEAVEKFKAQTALVWDDAA